MVFIDGIDPIQELLEELPKKLEDEVLPDALLQGANILLQTAKQLAPKRTGELANSLHIEAIDSGYVIVSDVDYANCVNDGTRKMPGQPFLDDAVATSGGTALDAIETRIDEVLE